MSDDDRSRTFWRPRYRFEGNIKLDLKEISFECVD